MTRRSTLRALGAMCVALSLFLQSHHSTVEAAAQKRAGKPPAFVDGELLVQFSASADDAQKNSARAVVKASRKRLVKGSHNGDLELAELQGNVTVAEAVALLRKHPAVEFAEPNWVYETQATANDPGVTGGYLWGMYGTMTTPSNAFGSRAADLWAQGVLGSDNVYVAVIDQGIDIAHPDLAPNIWTNPFDPADGFDNDGNGYVDDAHGWDFYAGDNSVFDGVPADWTVDSHGTHVAGTIGAVGGNALGVAGLNWRVRMISAKFLGPNGGTTAAAVAAVDYVTDLKLRHNLNIIATNNSWGGGGNSQALHGAILRAAKAGILFIAAAGNSSLSNDTYSQYPANYNTLIGTSTESAASYDSVISVAAITSSGARASFSNYGANTVDLGAPGSGIYSTVPQAQYASFSGTSMATPHVSGAAALYASVTPTASAVQIRDAILNSARATATTSLQGITTTGGRLNVAEFLVPAAPPPPAAPTTLSVQIISSSQLNLLWADRSTNESRFEIERCSGSTSCTNFQLVASVGANITKYSDTGLASATIYRYRVRAANSGGASAHTSPVSAKTKVAIPVAPSELTAVTGTLARQVALAWTDNSNNETSFRIQRCTGATCTAFSTIATIAANSVKYVDGSGVSGTTYRYRVRAVNSAGVSEPSNLATATAK